MGNTYTPEQRAEALRLFETDGATKAAQAIGCSRMQIYRWIKDASSRDTQPTDEQLATEERYQTRLRTSLRRRLLTTAHDVIDRIYQPHEEYMRGKEGIERVVYDLPKAGDVRAYATSAAIFLDKYRLEMGESTDRIDQSGVFEIKVNGADPAKLK